MMMIQESTQAYGIHENHLPRLYRSRADQRGGGSKNRLHSELKVIF